jgi:antirestriction protein ArdC
VEITPMARQDRAPREGGARSSIYDDITTRIIAELEAGRLPWVQPWGTASAKAPLALPRNAATQRQYSGINILILWGAVVQQGYPTQAWLTIRQALALGGNVRKGERGTTVVYADRFTPEDEKRRARETGDGETDKGSLRGSDTRSNGQIPFLKRFTVFNAAQCEGLPEEIAVVAPPPPPGMIEPQVEALIRATGIDFRIGGDRAFYVPALDYVQVPLRRPISSRSTGTARRCMNSATPRAMRRGWGGISRGVSGPRPTPSRNWWPR